MPEAHLHGGRSSSLLFPRGFGSGSKLVRRLPEWPSDVPGRSAVLGLLIPAFSFDASRLNVPAKLCLLRGVLGIAPGVGLRSLLYGGGSRIDPVGVGDGIGRPGLRDASRLERRLVVLGALGTGDADTSRPIGLRNGTVDAGRVDGGRCMRVGREDLRLDVGLTGRKLCPVSSPLTFVLPFHLGRLLAGGGCGRDAFRVAGVGVVAGVPTDGDDSPGLGIDDDFRLLRFELACGMPECRRTLDMVVRAADPTELPRLEPPIGVDAPFRPLPDTITDEAGELPGVSATLPVAGLSMVTMLEIESRSCWFLEILMSSSDESITLMLAFSASVLDNMSERSPEIAPFIVSRSLTPFWMMETTRSIAGT